MSNSFQRSAASDCSRSKNIYCSFLATNPITKLPEASAIEEAAHFTASTPPPEDQK
ncbi:hypothetical protein NDI44_28245 [Trichocoleus sp. DQ-A3]|uniref:hypothetical protein n=1 Tax=Coleofasciculus sp. FACHB-125 TaxID=2692784 RepID=UPI00198394E0|nr:hypothetical protein [Coleofasciculus sp. FACHB-125]